LSGKPTPLRSAALPLTLAALSVAAWFAMLAWRHPTEIADERGHWPAVLALSRGDWSAPRNIAMLPVFHLLAAGLVRIGGESLLIARGLSALATLVALLLIHDAARIRHGPTATAHTLLYLFSPVFFPYCVLAYTEPLTLLALAAAIRWHVRRRPAAAAGAALGACLVRQSSLPWAAFFAAWDWADGFDAAETARDPRVRRIALLHRTWPYLLATAGFAAFMGLASRWMVAPNEYNRAGFNIAQFYLFGLVVTVVFAPLWLEHLWAMWTSHLRPALGWPSVCALLVAAVGVLEFAFRNPHPFNRNPYFLHDQVLTLLATSAAARYVLATLLVIALPLLAHYLWSLPGRATTATVWFFAVLFLAPHWLVDHRYYAIPLLFIHFCTPYPPRQAKRLWRWNLLLTLAAAAYLVTHGSAYSGL
jgi:hypothetical protein